MHIFFFLFFCFAPYATSLEAKSFLSGVQPSLQKIYDITNSATTYLEDFNDRHLGNSVLGKMLGYEEIKSGLENVRTSRGNKKMSMAMMPLIFHVGATSTWMLLTTFLAAKSVAIGLILLVFKIAVSTAKVASFFTLLKSKHGVHHEHGWTPHGHFSERSLNVIPAHSDWNSYTPVGSHGDHHTGYKTPFYKEHDYGYGEIEYEKANTNKKDG